MWVCGILRLASDVLPVVIRRGAEPEDGDSVEPLAVLHELVQVLTPSVMTMLRSSNQEICEKIGL